MLSVLFDSPIETNGTFTLTQEIFLPEHVGTFAFSLTENPSVDEPSMLLLVGLSGVGLMWQRRLRHDFSAPTSSTPPGQGRRAQ
jgi:hypothetical protein